MSAVTREVFSSLARDAVHSSRRLHGSTATVVGSDLAIAAMNYRLLGAAFSNPSAARSMKPGSRGKRRGDGTWN